MLQSGIVSTDIQPLINPITGQALIVDLSEAVSITSISNPTDKDKLGIQAFIQETLSTIPSNDRDQKKAKIYLKQICEELHFDFLRKYCEE